MATRSCRPRAAASACRTRRSEIVVANRPWQRVVGLLRQDSVCRVPRHRGAVAVKRPGPQLLAMLGPVRLLFVGHVVVGDAHRGRVGAHRLAGPARLDLLDHRQPVQQVLHRVGHEARGHQPAIDQHVQRQHEAVRRGTFIQQPLRQGVAVGRRPEMAQRRHLGDAELPAGAGHHGLHLAAHGGPAVDRQGQDDAVHGLPCVAWVRCMGCMP